jgi:branched-chain amino acid transport system ATP-binding protein
MLVVEKIRVRYGTVQAVSDISVEVGKQEFVSVIGSNGAGKTSLVKAISGTVASTAARIDFNGADLRGMAPDRIARLGIAHVPEGRRVFKSMSVEDNLLMGAIGHPEGRRRIESQYELFARLSERRKQLAGTLSGGEQQMLAIARGLMSSPKLLILDEPSLGLAPNLVDQIFLFIQQVHQRMSMSILLVEQQAAEALDLSDRTYVVEAGRISLEGPSSRLAADDTIRKSYLGVR